jgi:hypothetical protein
MATFRRYGGMNHTQHSNIVRHNISNSRSTSFNTSGLYNSKETFLSHVDLSGNSLLGIGGVYFQDGTFLNTAANVDPTFAGLLFDNNSAGNYGINDVNYIYGVNEIKFSNGSVLNASFADISLAGVLSNGNSAGNSSINMNDNDIYGVHNLIASYDVSATRNVYGTDIIASNNVSASSVLATSDITLGGTIHENGDGIISNDNGVKNIFSSLCKYKSAPTYDDDNDIPTKQYVDNIASGIKPVESCNCATTGDIVLNPPCLLTSIDDVTLAYGYRVLVKSQGASSDESTSNVGNGIYVYKYDGTNPYLERANDCSDGAEVPNQVTFISGGTSNGMLAFIQDSSNSTVGIDKLKYVKFYALNYSLGQGLETVGGAKLQVTSSLEFLTKVKIQNNSFDIDNTPLMIGNDTFSKYIFFGAGLGNNAYNDIVDPSDNGIFSANTSTINNPLVISTWSGAGSPNGIRITNDSVKLQADSSNWYNLTTTGHNFYGNVNMNNIAKFISTTSAVSPTVNIGNSDIYHNDKTLWFVNNSDVSLGVSSFVFNCKNPWTDTNCNALAFESGIFTIDLSYNDTFNLGGLPNVVKYQACNANINGFNIGHTFTGNCYFNGLISLGVNQVVQGNTYSQAPTSNDGTIIESSMFTGLVTQAKYIIFFNICAIFQGGSNNGNNYEVLDKLEVTLKNTPSGSTPSYKSKFRYGGSYLRKRDATTEPYDSNSIEIPISMYVHDTLILYVSMSGIMSGGSNVKATYGWNNPYAIRIT